MFDKDLHKEYVFLSYLLGLIPPEPVKMIDLEGKLKLEYYKLEKRFEGAITLNEEDGKYQPASATGVISPETNEPLDEIIKKINEKYKGVFSDGDRVMLSALQSRLMNDKKLRNVAQTSDPKIFSENIFPKYFSDAAQDSYMESQETYKSLFEDQQKYKAVMDVLGQIVYRDMRQQAQP